MNIITEKNCKKPGALPGGRRGGLMLSALVRSSLERAVWVRALAVDIDNGPRSIYQYSNMVPRLSGQNCKFLNLHLSLSSQKRLEYKENNTK